MNIMKQGDLGWSECTYGRSCANDLLINTSWYGYFLNINDSIPQLTDKHQSRDPSRIYLVFQSKENEQGWQGRML